MTLDDFASRLRKAKPRTIKGCRGFQACCPAHEDKNPSFAVWEGADGFLHVKCQLGCSEDEILKALALTQEDRRVKELVAAGASAPQETIYSYTDLHGQYLFEKVRIPKADGSKDFRQRIRQADGTFNYKVSSSLNGKSKILYRIGEVMAAIRAGATVYINEGEKAVEAMRTAGLVATCQPAGASKEGEAPKWLPEHSLWLQGAHVVVVADRDPVGEAYARVVATSLKGFALSIKVVQSATTQAKSDAYDHFMGGHRVEDFVRREDLEPEIGFRVRSLEEFEYEEAEFLIKPYLRMRQINLLDAKGSSGKTTFILMLAATGSHGIDPFGNKIEPFKTLYFGTEDTEGELRIIFEREMGGLPGHFFAYSKLFRLDEANCEMVKETAVKLGVKLVVFDALAHYCAGLFKNPYDAMEIAPVLTRQREVARQTNTCILNVRHFARPGIGKAIEDMGAGSEQWRNSHRSQLVMRPHPDREAHPFLSIIQHTKGSLLNALGQPFGFSRTNGVLGWVRDIDLSVFDERRRGRAPTSRAEIVEWLRQYLRGGAQRVHDIRKQVEERGWGASALYAAKDELNLEERKESGYKVWALDPFDEAFEKDLSHVYRGGE